MPATHRPSSDVLALDRVCIGTEENYRLAHVSLAVTPGTVLAIIGPNGAGKSTLLNCLSGELPPDTGTAKLDGRSLTTWRAAPLARRRAVLPQHSTLEFDFVARDVVMMGRSPYAGGGQAADDKACQWALRATDTETFAERHYVTLSGGERQRIHMARVLAQLDREARKAGYLLLDEPTSALDLSHQHALLDLTRQLAGSLNLGVAVVLHDLNLAARYADRVALLQNGRLISDGTPSSVLTEKLLESVFELPLMVMQHPGRPDCPLIIAGNSMPASVSKTIANPEESTPCILP